MKVILDFQNLIEDSDLPKHLQAMAEMAKDAKGFCFYVNKGKYSGLQVYQLSNVTLATMIKRLEDDRPGIKRVKMMAEMSDMLGDLSSKRR